MFRFITICFSCFFMLLPASYSWSQAKLPPPELPDAAPDMPAKPPEKPQVYPGKMPDVTISARLERAEVPVNELVRFIVELRWDKRLGKTAELQFDFPDPPEAEGLVPVGNSFRTITELEGATQHVLRQYTYEYQPKQEGTTTIGKAVVAYRRLGAVPEGSEGAADSGESDITLETHPLEVNIISPSLSLRDIARGNAAKIIIAVILAASIAALAVLFLKEQRKRASAEPIITETLEEIYEKRLQDNETMRIAGRWPDYFLGLANIIKGYLADRHNIRTRGQTNDPLVSAAREKLGEDFGESLQGFFHISDRVKFAGHIPSSAEMDRAYRTAQDIIRSGESEGTEEPMAKNKINKTGG
jgi:hypothetical protein